jgi:hypothetical protein
MKSVERNKAVIVARGDKLSRLQLEVARRADELAQTHRAAADAKSDRECWLEAEREVLSRAGVGCRASGDEAVEPELCAGRGS